MRTVSVAVGCLGLGLVLVGAVLVPLPGPGILLAMLGAMLLVGALVLRGLFPAGR